MAFLRLLSNINNTDNPLRPSKKPNSGVINENPFNRRTICTPQSRAFINALLLNYFARSVDTGGLSL